jgi:hypothetical protein
MMHCVDLGNPSVRSGGAGDAWGIVKPSRRGNRVSQVNPKGRAFKALGRRQPALAMPKTSRRTGFLAQNLESAAQRVMNTHTGS